MMTITSTNRKGKNAREIPSLKTASFSPSTWWSSFGAEMQTLLKTEEIGSYTRLYWRSGISSNPVRYSTSFREKTEFLTPVKEIPGEKDACVKFVSASTQCTHAWTPEKNRLIIIILQCNTEHKNVFLHIPGLKITQITCEKSQIFNRD
jgi:hypothetical protein